MSPIERVLTWLWDMTGDRRRAMARRERLTTRAVEKRRSTRERALAQIRRTQALANQLEQRH